MNTTQRISHTSPRSRVRVFSAMLLAVFSGFVTANLSDAATITGRVINQGTGDYLKYAQVQISGTDRSVITEEGGVYVLTNVPAGEVKLSVTYTGLDAQEITVSVPVDGTVTQDVSLSTSEYGETIKLGTFSVSGSREGNAKAIVEQRIALNMKTVVAADTFGDVAEGNVGEFLKLLPGVSVDYVDNDVRSTRLRGLPPKYATTTLNGLPVANSGSNNLAALGQGRFTELEQLSMAALDIVETSKTPTPDMLGMNLAGNINAVSKSALNQKGRSIKYSASVNFNQWFADFSKSKGWDNKNHVKALPCYNVEWIDTFLGGKLGMVMSVAHSGAFANQRVTIGTYTWDRNADNNATELPLLNNWNFQDGLKPTFRDSLLLNLDYKVSDELMLTLATNYGYYRTEFYNRNWQVITNTSNLTTYAADGTLNTGIASPGLIDRNETSATSLGTAATSLARVGGSNQRKSGGLLNISPSASWKHENIKVDVAGMYSVGKTGYASGQDGYFSLVQADMQNVGWKYVRTAPDSVTIQQTSGSGSIFDLANYNRAGLVQNERRNAKAQMWSGKADVELAFPDWSVPTTFKAGLATSLEVRNIANLQARWTLNLTSGPTTGTAINLQDYPDPYSGGVGTVTDINGLTAKTVAADKWRLYQQFIANGNVDPFSLSANGAFVAQAPNNLRNLLQNDVDIKEAINSAYVMATVKPIKPLQVVAGLRFESTKSEGRAFDDIGRAKALALSGTTNTNDLNYIYARYGSRISREQTYSNVLPVVQGRYEISKSFISRFAYYSSLLRPDFQNVIGGLNAVDNGTAYTFNVNNSKLKPETAHNLDVSVEYYFEPVGIISASVFYKDIKNIQIVQAGRTFENASPDVQEQILEAGYAGDPGLTDPLTRVTTTVNGPQTTVWGLELAYSQELSFLPGPFKGLGVTANYSHYVPEQEKLWALVANAGDGMALDQGNLILRYKIGSFSTQVSATWTAQRIAGLAGLTLNPDGSFTTVIGNNSNLTGYQSARWVISPSAQYQINRYATLTLSVSNVFNSAKENYNEREVFTARNGNYGATITIGVKGSF